MDFSAGEPRAIAELTDRLQRRFPDVAADTVRAAVDSSYRGFEGRQVRDFVPVLVEREARQALGAPAA